MFFSFAESSASEADISWWLCPKLHSLKSKVVFSKSLFPWLQCSAVQTYAPVELCLSLLVSTFFVSSEVAYSPFCFRTPLTRSSVHDDVLLYGLFYPITACLMFSS